MTNTIYLDNDRNDLARLFKDKGYRYGAEIGVDRGSFSEILIKDNPFLTLFCIDPWKVYGKYADITDVETINKRYEEAVKRLAPYDCVIVRKSSEGAIKDVEDNELDFVYIDGNHAYEYVLQDLRMWSKKVRIGGIISGHDYTTRKHQNVGLDVKKAVDQFLEENDIETFYVYTKPVKSTWFFERKK